jgi:hypothetical protein
MTGKFHTDVFLATAVIGCISIICIGFYNIPTVAPVVNVTSERWIYVMQPGTAVVLKESRIIGPIVPGPGQWYSWVDEKGTRHDCNVAATYIGPKQDATAFLTERKKVK